MTESARVSNSGIKVLRVLNALKGHTLSGLSNGDLAKGLNESPATINRCLNTLIAENFAVKLDNGRYAQSIAFLQSAQAYTSEISSQTARIAELQQRVAAGSR